MGLLPGVAASPRFAAVGCLVSPLDREEKNFLHLRQERTVLAIAGTGYGLIGILVIILLVVLILYFVRRA
jgi:hypothetical protein